LPLSTSKDEQDRGVNFILWFLLSINGAHELPVVLTTGCRLANLDCGREKVLIENSGSFDRNGLGPSV
jgi:hypothetical protein